MIQLEREPQLYIRQRRELAEFFGFETRNKYEVSRADKSPVCYIAEQNKGIWGMLGRQFLGHWRTFELSFFTPDRQPILKAVHPFRWFFKRMEIMDAQGRPIGALQQRFAIIRKKFDVLAPDGRVLAEMESPFWKIWTFPFRRNGVEIAVLRKKWSGLLKEAVTDQDNFQLQFADASLKNQERILMLAAAVFVDLMYFEKKAGSNN